MNVLNNVFCQKILFKDVSIEYILQNVCVYEL